MQGPTQNSPLQTASLLQGQGNLPIAPSSSQLIDSSGESGSSQFLSSLKQSIQSLIDNGQLENAGAEPKAISETIEQLLAGQAANNGLQSPLIQGQDLAAKLKFISAQMNYSDEDSTVIPVQQNSESIESLLANIKLVLANGEGQPQSNPLTLITQPDTSKPLEITRSLDTTKPLEITRSLDTTKLLDISKSLDITKQPDTVAMMQPDVMGRRLMERLTTGLQSQSGLNDADPQQPVETTPLLMRESAERLSANPSTMLNPALLERALTNKDQRANPEMLNLNSSQLDPIAALQTGQTNRNVAVNGSADVRPAQSFIQTPLTDPQWQTDFSNKIVMFTKGAAQGQAQVAEIRLNPPHMGAIEVKVVINDDLASVTFASQHGAVRDAIESSMPRLREMFNISGLMLSDAEVSDQSLHERRQQENQHAPKDQHDNSGPGFHLDEESEQLVRQIDLASLHASSSLDLYA